MDLLYMYACICVYSYFAVLLILFGYILMMAGIKNVSLIFNVLRADLFYLIIIGHRQAKMSYLE